MYQGIPIIGIAGGIGSGKSHVSMILAEFGCLVIDSDRQITEAYKRPEVMEAIHAWWGDAVFSSTGSINRSALARQIFSDSVSRAKLESLLHPIVAAMREQEMRTAALSTSGNRPLAFVWDTPLLFETGLWKDCDAVIFVEVPREERLRRVTQSRGWDDGELRRRENSQWPLDNKRNLSHYVLENPAPAAAHHETGQAGIPLPNPDKTQAAELKMGKAAVGEPVVQPLRDQIWLVLSRVLHASSGPV